eukprot:TRINITY_DN8785_c0_g1_i1.p1 TRINITY_DN8785_c0_g1~~TRINITY_DN8785_c0_g1_i1.p1  ORF type:complete len:408 (-),score=91.95 TRINITY_DN8785_c0_g1_i1:80-1207(-)
MNVLNDPHITICGHNFCPKCIEDALNLKKSCPCCNKQITIKEVFKNHHLNSIISLLKKEKEIESKKQFSNLLNKSNNKIPTLSFNNQKNEDMKFSPIETIFHNHMKKSLSQYEIYYQEIKSRYLQTMEKLNEDYVNRMWNVEKEGSEKKVSKEVMGEEIKKLKEECEQKKKELQDNFSNLEKLLIENYDKFFSQFAIEPIFLPVSVNIKLECENVLLQNIVIKSDETLSHLRSLVKSRLQEINNPLLEDFKERNLFLLQRAFSNDKDNLIILTEKTPFASFKIEQGSLIVVRGALKLQSNKPLVCFSLEFDPNVKKSVNYFTCKTCNLNWICENCSGACHNGHLIQSYILNHQPSYACCYCKRSKNVKCNCLQNK